MDGGGAHPLEHCRSYQRPHQGSRRQTKRISCLIPIVFLLLGSLSFATEETPDYGRFGKVALNRNTPQPSHVVLFVAGDGCWNPGVVDMAQSLAGLEALVIGIDITHYLR